MNVKAWIVQELRAGNRTVFDFFDECYRNTHHKACQSNQIVLDANHYRTSGVIPSYVWSVFDRLQQQKRVLPAQAAKTSRWTDTWNHQHYRLVSESAPLLMAHKDKDGVYRC